MACREGNEAMKGLRCLIPGRDHQWPAEKVVSGGNRSITNCTIIREKLSCCSWGGGLGDSTPSVLILYGIHCSIILCNLLYWETAGHVIVYTVTRKPV